MHASGSEIVSIFLEPRLRFSIVWIMNLTRDERRLAACAPEEEQESIKNLFLEFRAVHGCYRAWQEHLVRDPLKFDPLWRFIPQPARNMGEKELHKQSAVQRLRWANTWAGLANLPGSERMRLAWQRALQEEEEKEKAAAATRRLKDEAKARRDARHKEEQARRRRARPKPESGYARQSGRLQLARSSTTHVHLPAGTWRPTPPMH